MLTKNELYPRTLDIIARVGIIQELARGWRLTDPREIELRDIRDAILARRGESEERPRHGTIVDFRNNPTIPRSNTITI